MSQTRYTHIQREMRACAYCHGMFVPKRSQDAFCNNKCRSGWHTDHGAEGRVVSVRRLGKGRVSIVAHFDAGPAAEHAIRIQRDEVMRLVKQPKVEV